MAKYSSYGNSGKSGSNSSRSGSNSGGVSSARLHQRCGDNNAFGGYAKVANKDGTYRMRKTSR